MNAIIDKLNNEGLIPAGYAVIGGDDEHVVAKGRVPEGTQIDWKTFFDKLTPYIGKWLQNGGSDLIAYGKDKAGNTRRCADVGLVMSHNNETGEDTPVFEQPGYVSPSDHILSDPHDVLPESLEEVVMRVING